MADFLIIRKYYSVFIQEIIKKLWPWTHLLGQENFFYEVWRFEQLTSSFLANGHFFRVSRQSRLSEDKSDNVVKPKGWADLTFTFRLRKYTEHSRKKIVRNLSYQWSPQMGFAISEDDGGIAQHVMDKEGKKEGEMYVV